MSGHSEAVTTGYHPSHYHDTNTLAISYNSSTSSRPRPIHSQSVDLNYGSNQRAPLMNAGSCAQQQRLVKYPSVDQAGFSPRGQSADPSTGAYECSSRASEHMVHISPDKRNCSVYSVQNERYKLDAPSHKDHDNEDEFLVHANSYSLCLCVFDGHDGSQAVKFVQRYMKANIFDTKSWVKLSEFNQHEEMESALAEFIKVTDKDFFKSIRNFISEKLYLQSEIPKLLYMTLVVNKMDGHGLINTACRERLPKKTKVTQYQLQKDYPKKQSASVINGMKSYQAQQTFPVQVARLQQLESKISGGCTAVVAVITNNRLYVANVGDSRAILAYEESDGSLQVKQLSEDHGVENEQEMQRLMALGLDREQLKKSGRLGTQENTRSIGDYSIKGGYKDIDVLSHATDEPGIAVPYVMSVPIDCYSFKYLILMSDGVYKTIEAITGDVKKEGGDGNSVIVTMIEQHVAKNGWDSKVASSTLKRICQIQYDLYQQSARQDERSPTAVANRKRDDMTLVVYKFDIHS